MLKRLAEAMAAQFGSNCEIVVHDLSSHDPENTIVAIETGHVSNRSLGGGSSPVVLEAMHNRGEHIDDRLSYHTRTADGRTLRSSTIYINDADGAPEGIFSINYDITPLMMARSAVDSLVSPDKDDNEASRIPTSVNELLDELIESSVKLIGKPVAMMNKDDKIRAIRYLNEKGAMLITKSGDRISNYFGISKYTLYSYLDSGSGGLNRGN